MTPDEQRIWDFLQTAKDFLSARQIGLYAAPPGGSVNPAWAQPFLIRLTKAGLLKMNAKGDSRWKPSPSGIFKSVRMYEGNSNCLRS